MIHPLTQTFANADTKSSFYYEMCNESPHYLHTQFVFKTKKGLIVLKICKMCFLSRKKTPVQWNFLNNNFQPINIIRISDTDCILYGDICDECLKK